MAGSLLHARTFVSLRKHRNYRLYFGGQVVSLTGTWVQNVALAWLVGVVLSHSALAVGILAVCQFGPYAVLGLVGGVVSDRFPKRATLIITQTLSMITAAALAGLTISHHITIGEAYILAAVGGVILCFDTPARQSFTIEMVGRSELPNAVALNSSMFNLSRVAGPAIGGLLIATVGIGACFAVNAISFLAVLLCLVLMRSHEFFAGRRADTPVRFIRGTGEAISYVWRTPAVRTVVLMITVIATIGFNFNVLLPILAAHTLLADSRGFGVLSAAFGAGALGGALLSASMPRASLRVLVAAAVGAGVGELIVAPLHTLWGAALALVLIGVTFSLYTSNSNSTVQLNTPDHLRGRVMGIYAYVFFATAPLGGYLAGWLSGRGGTQLAFVVAGGATLLTALTAMVWIEETRPVLRRRRRLGTEDELAYR